MRSIRSLLLIAVVLSVPGLAAAQAPAKAAAPAAAPSAEQAMKALRDDLQAARADVMAKALTLTADQASRFWPMFEKFQQEQNAVIDSQLEGIQKYADAYRTLTDADAVALMNEQLTQDEKMTALCRKWLAEFQKVLPAKEAVRAIQVDRRIANAVQVKLSSEIPLVPRAHAGDPRGAEPPRRSLPVQDRGAGPARRPGRRWRCETPARVAGA